MIVPAHPKEDVNASRADKEKKVMKEEKNRNKKGTPRPLLILLSARVIFRSSVL